MEKEYQGTGQHTNRSPEPSYRLSEKQLQDLEWARDFMRKYEQRKRK